MPADSRFRWPSCGMKLTSPVPTNQPADSIHVAGDHPPGVLWALHRRVARYASIGYFCQTSECLVIRLGCLYLKRNHLFTGKGLGGE